jgi:large subunit ribosomal protein L31
MRPGIHPDYRPVVFEDSSAGIRWITRSTVRTERTTVWDDGNEYPHVLLDISQYTHPFFTGQMKIVDTAGRIDRFNKRHGARRREQSA